MLWICSACTTGYAVGAPQCPHCGANDHHDEGVAVVAGEAGPEVILPPDDDESDDDGGAA